MNLLDEIIEAYRRWIKEAKAKNESTAELETELSFWEYTRAWEIENE